MISKVTQRGVLAEIRQWCMENDIEEYELASLLRRLSNVPGNKSYTDSMNALFVLVDREAN